MLKQLLTIIVFILTVSMICETANGVVVPTLYSAHVKVSSKSIKERHNALLKTFKIVLVKVSGCSDIITKPQINETFAHVDDYVETFNYSAISEGKNGSLLLEVRFNKSSVDELLSYLGQTVWEKNRPLMLGWLVVEKDGIPKLINQDNDPILSKLISDDAFKRGVPLIFPMLDMTDMQQISSEDIIALKTTLIRTVSKRYMPDVILVGRINMINEKHVIGYWTLLDVGKSFTLEIERNHLSTVIHSGVSRIVDILAKRFTTQTIQAQEQVVELKVDSLNNVDDYAKLINYLHTLTGVINVEVLHISKTSADFRLILNTPVQSLIRTIRLDSILKPVETHNIDTNILYYRFIIRSERHVIY